MTTAEVYKILEEPKKKRALIDCCLTEIANLHSLATSIKSFSFDKEKVMNGACDGNAHFVSAIEKILDKEEQIQSDVDSYLEAYNEAELLIGKLSSNLLKAVLHNTYLLFLSDKEISKKMHFSERHIRRLRNKAVEILIICP